ncbi:LexA family transcriptional regulator [Pyramidobacter porci]|uniref:LexA family transcriptional regulator n=1 Tax=Pyramidobacter porci TaxID=2605789 RepID=UPI002A75F8D2|nr:LexA family transcriptional regulator [Pyramidobacter porci]
MLLDTLGKKIKYAREKARLTQEELGKAFGKSKWTVIRIEQDKADPSYAELEKIAHATGVTAIDLLDPHWPEETKNAPSPQGERVQRRIDTNLIEIPVISREWTACCGGGVTALDLTSEDGRVVSIPRASLRAYDDLRPPFAIYCEGDCLESDGIFEGDVVVVNPAEEPLNGATALVSIAGSLSLKHVFTLRNGDVILKSDQGERRLSREQQDNDEFMVCGAMVCSIRRPRVWTL